MSKKNINHPLSFEEATKLIRCFAKSDATEWVFDDHVLERMSEREIRAEWIEQVLKEGEVIRRRKERNSYRYRVRYTDKYGHTDVVTVIPRKDCLVIVTVMRDD